MGLPGGAALGQHVAATAQGGAPMSGSEAWPLSINGQGQAQPVGRLPRHGQQNTCANGDESAAPPRQTPQPAGNSWRIRRKSGHSPRGNKQNEERTRGSPEGSNRSRLREGGQGSTVPALATPTYISVEGVHDARSRLVQPDGGTAADANVITQGDNSGASDARIRTPPTQ